MDGEPPKTITTMIAVEALRACIDEADRAALWAINRRAGLVKALIERKRSEGLPLRDEAREIQILSRLTGLGHGSLSDEAVRRIYTVILEECRKAAGL